MYQATFTPEQGWSGQLQPYAPLQLDPSAQVLNYGQSVFEGMKAQRTAGGNIVLFRPDENAARMMAGAHQWHSLLLRDELYLACHITAHLHAGLPSLSLTWRRAFQKHGQGIACQFPGSWCSSRRDLASATLDPIWRCGSWLWHCMLSDCPRMLSRCGEAEHAASPA